MILMSYLAIISFLAAFFLIRYNLKEAKNEELEVEGNLTPSGSSSRDLNKAYPLHQIGRSASLRRIWTTNPHLEQVGPFRRKPPTHLLSRCHSLCIALSALGFAMALMGILCFGWARQPTAVSVVATACMGICFLSGALVFLPTHKTPCSYESLLNNFY